MGVGRTFLPGLMETHEDIRALEAEFRQAGEQDVAFRIYDKLFARITRMWVNEELHSPEVEPWRDFCERVDRGIAQIRNRAGQNAPIVGFTSGGEIAPTGRAALDLSPQPPLGVTRAPRSAP